MQFSIRKYTLEDKKELLQMMKEFFSSPAVLHNVPESYFQRTLDELEKESPFLDVYVFESNEITKNAGAVECQQTKVENIHRLAGYGAVTKTYSNEAGGLCFWFDEIYVREEFRGKGIGGTFIQQIIAEHPEVKRFRLETEPENERAVRLYKKLGFEKLGYNQYST